MKITEKQLLKRVQGWQLSLEPLGIGHFHLDLQIVEEVPGAEGAQAGVNPSVYYDRCWMNFSREFLEENTIEAIDKVIIHEWLHVAWRDYAAAVDSIGGELAPAVRGLWSDRLEHEAEGIIERLALTLYGFYSTNMVQS